VSKSFVPSPIYLNLISFMLQIMLLSVVVVDRHDSLQTILLLQLTLKNASCVSDDLCRDGDGLRDYHSLLTYDSKVTNFFSSIFSIQLSKSPIDSKTHFAD
jgi:hypothetical protein